MPPGIGRHVCLYPPAGKYQQEAIRSYRTRVEGLGSMIKERAALLALSFFRWCWNPKSCTSSCPCRVLTRNSQFCTLANKIWLAFALPEAASPWHKRVIGNGCNRALLQHVKACPPLYCFLALLSRTLPAHEAPQATCTCGIYAAKSFDHLRGQGYLRRGIRGGESSIMCEADRLRSDTHLPVFKGSSRLSQRELKIVRYLTQGLTDREIRPSRIVHHNRQRGMIVPLPRRLTIVGTRRRQTIVRRQIALRPISRRPGPNVRNNRNKLRRKEGARRSNASSRNLLNS